MTVTVRVPSALRAHTAGERSLTVNGSNVNEVLEAVDHAYPGFRSMVVDDSGSVKQFVNVFVDDEDIRVVGGLGAPVTDGTTLSIVPAVAGG